MVYSTKEKVNMSQDQQLKFNFTFQTASPQTDRGSIQIGIEHRFPVEEANELASAEAYNKHLYRPNTYLHKWWARRSGTTFRYILKQLCDLPEKRGYYEPGGLEGKVILDPMMGGGTTVHEAIRLGASVVGFDLDPIPVIQAKASLTHVGIEEKERVFNDFYRQLSTQLNPFFQTTCPNCREESEVQFILYAIKKSCGCREALFVDNLWLREELDGSGITLNPFTGLPDKSDGRVSEASQKQIFFEKTVQKCPECNAPFKERRDIPFVERYLPFMIHGWCNTHRLFFKPVDLADLGKLETAREHSIAIDLPFDNLIIHPGPKSVDLIKHNIHSFSELFTSRQILYIAKAKELLTTVPKKHQIWLSMLISTSLEFNSLLCGYKGGDKRRPGAIRHVFSHHAYSFPHTALENNPVFSRNSSGTLGLLYEDRIKSAAAWAEAPVERKLGKQGWKKVIMLGEKDAGEPAVSLENLTSTPRKFYVKQQDSTSMPLDDNCIDHVVTDPPYYDSVQYSDLAQFFRGWLSWFLPEEANWAYLHQESAVAESTQDGDKYQKVLSAIWAECYRVLKKPSGRLIFTFHHWRPEAWAHLALSLKHAKFRLVTSYTIFSENPISVHIRQLNALKHDSVLVLKPYNGVDDNPTYENTDHIPARSSDEFCTQCAQYLGYCLQADLTDQKIIENWKRVLGT
jgi:putative DNA methylase